MVLTVTVGDGRLFVQENDEPKQEYLADSEHDFYSTASSDEVTFAPADGSTAQVMILHLDGKDVPLKRLPQRKHLVRDLSGTRFFLARESFC